MEYTKLDGKCRRCKYQKECDNKRMVVCANINYSKINELEFKLFKESFDSDVKLLRTTLKTLGMR